MNADDMIEPNTQAVHSDILEDQSRIIIQSPSPGPLTLGSTSGNNQDEGLFCCAAHPREWLSIDPMTVLF